MLLLTWVWVLFNGINNILKFHVFRHNFGLQLFSITISESKKSSTFRRRFESHSLWTRFYRKNRCTRLVYVMIVSNIVYSFWWLSLYASQLYVERSNGTHVGYFSNAFNFLVNELGSIWKQKKGTIISDFHQLHWIHWVDNRNFSWQTLSF